MNRKEYVQKAIEGNRKNKLLKIVKNNLKANNGYELLLYDSEINIEELKEIKLKELDFKITNYIYSKYKITKQINIQREYFLNPNDENKKEEFIQMNLFINNIRDNFHKLENEINNIQGIEELENIDIANIDIEQIDTKNIDEEQETMQEIQSQ